jgi:hypothetical protein
MPNKKSHADIAAALFPLLRDLHLLHPELLPDDLATVLKELIIFGHKNKLLTPTPAKLTPKKQAAAGDQLRLALEAALDALAAASAGAATSGDGRSLTELRYKHHALHIDRAGSYYSFASPYKLTHNKRSITAIGLTTVDSAGNVFPTEDIDEHLSKRVKRAERAAANCAPHLLTAPPELLLGPKGLASALARLRSGLPGGLPFRHPLHERRLRVWCLMTYLHPLVESTPFLRVRVPDVRSARNVQHLLEACCYNALGVARSGMKTLVRRHRKTLACTTIFSPELRTGRLPSAALDLLEDLPRAELREPPVAYIELWDDTRPPRVPEEWVVDVELAGQVGPVPLPPDHRHLGCAVALSDGGALLAKAPLHEGTAGLAGWLQELLYGDQLSDAQLAAADAAVQQAAGFVVHDSPLAEYVEQVWDACAREGEDSEDDKHGKDNKDGKDGKAGDAAKMGKQQRRCNPACLRQRILERFPDARKLLEAKGWEHRFSRRLLEHGLVTYALKELSGCLSPIKTAQWRSQHARGVEVPVHRLPAGLKLGI